VRCHSNPMWSPFACSSRTPPPPMKVSAVSFGIPPFFLSLRFNNNIQCVKYTRIVLLAELNRMWERGWNCVDTASNLQLRLGNSESNWFTVKYCDLISIFSAKYVGTGYINNGSMMHQRCIIGTSIASTCSSWWPVARTRTNTPEKERQRQTDRDRKTKWKIKKQRKKDDQRC